jgi:hypothetical protein
MSEIPNIPIEQVKDSTVKFELANLKLELDGTLQRLKGESQALSELQTLLSDALEKCSLARAELDLAEGKQRRIPDD